MPLFTIVVCGRDDCYQSSYPERFNLSLQSCLNVLPQDTEIIIVDFNQVSNKPLSNKYTHRRIKHIVITREEYINKIKKQMKSGSVFLGPFDKELSPEEVVQTYPILYNLAINAGINAASGEYFIFFTPDVIIPKYNINNLINNLDHNYAFCVHAKSISLDNAKKYYNNIIYDENNDYYNEFTYYPKQIKQYIIGSTLFYVVHSSIAKRMRLLPYVMPRSKGVDLFLAYMIAADGYKSIIPNYCVLDIVTPESKKSSKYYNYIIRKRKNIYFDFNKDYILLRNWIHSHSMNARNFVNLILPTQPYELKQTDPNFIDKLTHAFRRHYV